MNESITLQLPDPDSIRCLRRALENGALSFTSMEAQQTFLAQLCTSSGRKNEAARHTRRASEYARRAALTQQLVDQLPANTPPMFAPTGER